MKLLKILPHLPVVDLLDFERGRGLVAEPLRGTLLLELQLAFGKGGRVDVCFLRKRHHRGKEDGANVQDKRWNEQQARPMLNGKIEQQGVYVALQDKCTGTTGWARDGMGCKFPPWQRDWAAH